MIFREAEIADVPALIEIRLSVDENKLSDPSTVTADVCIDYLTNRGKGWVCESGGNVLGFSIACSSDRSIWALFVRPGREGLGIGQQLLNLATDWLFELGAETVVLSTGAGTRAESFYKRRGWIESGTTDEGEILFRLPRPETVG